MLTSTSKSLLLLSVFTAVCLAAIVASLVTGSVELSISELWAALINPEASMQSQVVWDLRIPRTFAALVTGGLLGLSGVIMQVLLRNPLADPYILGVSGGASAAALALLLSGLSAAWMPQAAFAGAILSIVIVFGLANAGGRWSVTRLLLT
ncbi:MAG: iron ABC transporter permease, partial [Gammaproteobacteria bacterium]|nr:iron ABC transporter permease [Gammaproteobacteria bacterium]